MDPITHALSGVLIKNLGFKRKASLLVLVVSAMAADIDYISRLWGADAMLRYHGGITHSFVFMLLFPVAVGLFFRNRGGFAYYWMLATIGCGVHIALDMTSGPGIRLFAPLDWRAMSIGVIFWTEPMIILLFIASILMSYLNAERARVVSVATLALLVLFIWGKGQYQDRASEFLRASMPEYRVESVSPVPNTMSRWWFIALSGNEIKTGFVDLFTRHVYVQKSYPQDQSDPAIESSKKYGVVKNFLNFAQYPYAEIRKNGNITVITWRELSLAYLPDDSFTIRLDVGNDGKLIGSRVKI